MCKKKKNKRRGWTADEQNTGSDSVANSVGELVRARQHGEEGRQTAPTTEEKQSAISQERGRCDGLRAWTPPATPPFYHELRDDYPRMNELDFFPGSLNHLSCVC